MLILLCISFFSVYFSFFLFSLMFSLCFWQHLHNLRRAGAALNWYYKYNLCSLPGFPLPPSYPSPLSQQRYVAKYTEKLCHGNIFISLCVRGAEGEEKRGGVRKACSFISCCALSYAKLLAKWTSAKRVQTGTGGYRWVHGGVQVEWVSKTNVKRV